MRRSPTFRGLPHTVRVRAQPPGYRIIHLQIGIILSNLRPTRIQKKAFKRADGTRVRAHSSTVHRSVTPAVSQVRGPVAGAVNSTTPSPLALGIEPRPPLANLVVNEFRGWNAAFNGDRTGFDLDRRTGLLRGFTEHESVNTWTRDEASGNVMRFHFERPLGRDAMEAIVQESMEDLGSLVTTHDEHWDGQNFVAAASDAAEAAVERIKARLEVDLGDPSEYQMESFESLRGLIEALPYPYGVTVGYSDEDETRSYTDDRTGQAVYALFEPGDDVEEVGAKYDAAMEELSVAVEAYDEDNPDLGLDIESSLEDRRWSKDFTDDRTFRNEVNDDLGEQESELVGPNGELVTVAWVPFVEIETDPHRGMNPEDTDEESAPGEDYEEVIARKHWSSAPPVALVRGRYGELALASQISPNQSHGFQEAEQRDADAVLEPGEFKVTCVVR